MRTSALFGAKKLKIFKFMLCPHGQGRLSQCGHFFGEGGWGGFFSRFCADVFYCRPLTVIFELKLAVLKFLPSFVFSLMFNKDMQKLSGKFLDISLGKALTAYVHIVTGKWQVSCRPQRAFFAIIWPKMAG